MKYYYNITESENGFTITFPDVPEAITCGATREEAISHAEDCLRTTLTFYIDKNKSLPEAKTVTDSFVELKFYTIYVSYVHKTGIGGIGITSTKDHVTTSDLSGITDYIEKQKNCEEVAILNIIALPVKLNPIEEVKNDK